MFFGVSEGLLVLSGGASIKGTRGDLDIVPIGRNMAITRV
jgi:hypothetical protein